MHYNSKCVDSKCIERKVTHTAGEVLAELEAENRAIRREGRAASSAGARWPGVSVSVTFVCIYMCMFKTRADSMAGRARCRRNSSICMRMCRWHFTFQTRRKVSCVGRETSEQAPRLSGKLAHQLGCGNAGMREWRDAEKSPGA